MIGTYYLIVTMACFFCRIIRLFVQRIYCHMNNGAITNPRGVIIKFSLVAVTRWGFNKLVVSQGF